MSKNEKDLGEDINDPRLCPCWGSLSKLGRSIYVLSNMGILCCLLLLASVDMSTKESPYLIGVVYAPQVLLLRTSEPLRKRASMGMAIINTISNLGCLMVTGFHLLLFLRPIRMESPSGYDPFATQWIYFFVWVLEFLHLVDFMLDAFYIHVLNKYSDCFTKDARYKTPHVKESVYVLHRN